MGTYQSAVYKSPWNFCFQGTLKKYYVIKMDEKVNISNFINLSLLQKKNGFGQIRTTNLYAPLCIGAVLRIFICTMKQISSSSVAWRSL